MRSEQCLSRAQCNQCEVRVRSAISAQSQCAIRVHATKLAGTNYQEHRVAMNAVGASVPRKDGIGKATGAARYADDIVFPGMLHGRTIRSTIPRRRIRSNRFDFDTTGFTIADYRDVPAKNAVDLIAQDQPFLAESEVKHMAEPI